MMAELPHFTTSPRSPTPMTRFCSIFNQLLQLFPRTDFQRAVHATKAERHARGFSSWDQFVAMLFAQLGRGAFAARDSAAAWPAAKASWRISGSRRRVGRHWPTRMRIARGSSSTRVLPGAGAVSRGRRFQAVPVQEQTPQSRRHGDRRVRGDVSVGGVSSHQRRREAAFHARSRRVLCRRSWRSPTASTTRRRWRGSRRFRRGRLWSSTRGIPTSRGLRT